MVYGASPAIVLIPGVFAPFDYFQSFESHLNAAGFLTVVAPILSADSEDLQNASYGIDAQHIRNKIFLPLINESMLFGEVSKRTCLDSR